MRIKAATIATVLSLLVACGPGPGDLGGGDAARIETTGDLSIVAPEPGAVFAKGEPIPVSLELTGATILEEASKDIQPDTGHVHVALNGKLLSLLSGLEFELLEMSPDPIEPGMQILEVEFVAADHGPFAPREAETVTFMVRGSGAASPSPPQ